MSPPTSPALRWLWFSLLAGPVIWSLYFILGYGLVEASCYIDLFGGQIWGIEIISIIILSLTLIAMLVTLSVGFRAYGHWQRLRGEEPNRRLLPQADGYAHFMAWGGVILSGLFAFIILVTGLPVFFLQPC